MEAIIHSYISSFPTFILILLIAITFYTLSKGADILVDEAVNLSLRWGVPKMVIGSTIVTLGTVLPETTVSVLAAINGNPDLTLGNAVGSIIVDTSLIIGIAAILGHLPVDQMIMKRHGMIQLVAGILLAIVTLPFWSGGNSGKVSQMVGVLFLVLLIIYMFISLKWAKNSRIDEVEQTEKGTPLIFLLLKLVAGFFLVIISSMILIPSIEITAIRIGMPQSIVAATLVAFGTSLPELITAITSVKKGHGELAIGNVVGDGIFNVFFVTGAAASVTKGGLEVPVIFNLFHIPTMLIALFIFNFFARRKKNYISRNEGIILVIIYLTYLVLNYI